MNGNKRPRGENSSNSTSRMPKLEGDVNQSSAELATLMNANKVLEKRNRDTEEANKRFAADLAAQAKKFADLESVNKNIMKLIEDQTTQSNKVTGLECKIKTLEGNATLLISVLAVQSNKIVDLESKNMTLEGNVLMKTNANLAMQTNKVVDLELRNKTLEDNVRKGTADLAARDNTISDLESKIKTLEDNASDLATQTNKVVADLESKNKTLEGKVMKATADLAAETNKVIDLEYKNKTLEENVTKATTTLAARNSTIRTLTGKEEWMNDDDPHAHSDWVGVNQIQRYPAHVSNVNLMEALLTPDLGLTNVRASHSLRLTLNGQGGLIYRGVVIENLTPNHEKARFNRYIWFTFPYNGKTYVVRALSPC